MTDSGEAPNAADAVAPSNNSTANNVVMFGWGDSEEYGSPTEVRLGVRAGNDEDQLLHYS